MELVVAGAGLEEAKGTGLEARGAEVGVRGARLEVGGAGGAEGTSVEASGGGIVPRDTQGLDCGAQNKRWVLGAQKI